MDISYPPPSIPGVTQGAPSSEEDNTPLSQLASDKKRPGMNAMLLAIQHLQQAQVDDPRLVPITGEALKLLLGPQRTYQSPDTNSEGLTPGGAL